MEKIYENQDIRVLWHPERCSHSARCLNGLPGVFNLNQRPWVNLNAAPAEDVIRTIDTCPSGALQYELAAGSKVSPEAARGPGWIGFKADTPRLKIKLIKDGPMVLDGQFEIIGPDGQVIEQNSKATLCRCGLSGKKPYCDGTHFRRGWKEN